MSMIILVDPEKVAEVMIDTFGFEPTVENMEINRDGYSDSLLDALTKLYNLEGAVDQELYARLQ